MEVQTNNVAREILKFHTICRYIVRNKIILWPLVIQLVWCILKQLFTSLSVKVMDIYLAASRLGKYPPLFTSTSVNNLSSVISWTLLILFNICLNLAYHKCSFIYYFIILYM